MKNTYFKYIPVLPNENLDWALCEMGLSNASEYPSSIAEAHKVMEEANYKPDSYKIFKIRNITLKRFLEHDMKDAERFHLNLSVEEFSSKP